MFTVYFVVFGLAITLFSSFIGYELQMINIKEQIDNDAQKIAGIKKSNILKPSIDRMNAIATALASNEALREYLVAPSAENKKNLINVFYAIAASDRLIMQARFLDASGKEKVRVDRIKESDAPFVVADDKLQDKSARDYFQIVSKMTTPTHWHSKLDLNIENGKIEVPYRPTIRVAIPLLEDKKFVGMVIVNMLTSDLLANLRASAEFDHFIIDKDGNFILHPDDKYSWGKYTKVKQPTAEKITLITSPEDGLYAFSINDILKNDDGAVLVLKHKKEHENSIVSANIKTALIIALLSAIISIPLAIYASVTPSRLQKALVSSNIELKRFADIIDRYVITATTKTSSIITAVSSAFAKTSGYHKDELVGKSISIVKHPDTPKELFEELWGTIAQGKEWQGEIKNRQKDGSEYWIDQTVIPVKNEMHETVSYMSVGVDITAKKELEKISTIDKLTGAMTRRKLDEIVCIETERAVRSQKPLSFILVDIDHFKKVNDTYGHQAGDYVLKATADLLTKNIRKSDMLGRYGGEEFLIVCPDTNGESAMILAQKLRKTVFEYDFGTVGQKSISLGVAELAMHECPDELIKRADSALYEAKNGGRNQAVLAANLLA
jgi:diguanylate cyclase (GGDEF)-like protein/PAS domain S-box-containing protein